MIEPMTPSGKPPESIASGFGPECAGRRGITRMREDFGAEPSR